jgi:hypothetical protein
MDDTQVKSRVRPPWLEGLTQLVTGPQLQAKDRLLPWSPHSQHAVTPFNDHVLVRDCYDVFIKQLTEGERQGRRGAIVLATEGFGIEDFLLVVIKRSVTLDIAKPSWKPFAC